MTLAKGAEAQTSLHSLQSERLDQTTAEQIKQIDPAFFKLEATLERFTDDDHKVCLADLTLTNQRWDDVTC